MALATRTSTAGAMAQVDRLRNARSMAGRAALIIMARPGVQVLVNVSPRDTNRYVRGWMMAANQAGVGPWTLPRLEKSQYLERIADRLMFQRRVLQERVNVRKEAEMWWSQRYTRWYLNKNRKDRSARTCLAKLREAVKRREKAEAMLARNEEESMLLNQHSIFMGARRKRGGPRWSDQYLRTLGDLGRVSNKPYGGEGSIEEFGMQLYVRLHNKEPHCQIIEARLAVVRRANAMVKSHGLVRARAQVARIMEEQVQGGIAVQV